MITNHTVTPAPDSAPVELDPVLAHYVAETLAALRSLDHHLRGRTPSERHVGLSRATDATREGVSQMLAASDLHPTARPEAQTVTR